MKPHMNNRTDVDRALREWLRSHQGLITRSEAHDVGATDDVIRKRVQRGEWEVVFRGVYRDATASRTAHQDLLAACLATGADAVASHRSAAWLWGLVDQPPPAPELTLPRRDQHGRRLRGVAARQSADLDDRRTIVRRGIPCTDALRTLVDVGAVISAGRLTDAVDRALATRLVTVAGLVAEVGRVGRSGRNGVGPLRRVLTERGFAGAPEPSVLESQAQRLFRRQGLPVPSFELVTGPEGEYRLDAAYPTIFLGIEFDGYECHFSPEHLARDHMRRNRLQGQGRRCLIYSWGDVVREPRRVAREIAFLYADLSREGAASQLG
jgi:hypothetical protein